MRDLGSHARTSAKNDETPLTGGYLTSGIVRVGDTVRRPANTASTFVAQLLAYLESQNVNWAPRYLGQDELGRDMLSYVPGSARQKWQHFGDLQIQAAARLLRKLHDTTRNSMLSANREVVCHHDPGPNNFVFDGDEPIALIDFDMAAPGEPMEDVAYMAWAWCISSRADRQPVSEQARQVRVLLDAYGLDIATRRALIDAVVARQTRNILFWSERLRSDQHMPIAPAKIRELIEWSQRELAYTTINREWFSLATD